MTYFDSRHQRAALLLTLLGVGVAIALTPYVTGLIAVPVLYVVFAPIHGRLSRFGGRGVAAIVVVLLTILLVVLPGVSIVGMLADRAQAMARQVTAGPLLERISGMTFGPFDVGSRLVAISEQVVTWLGGNALKLVGTAARFVINLLITLFGLYYLLLNGSDVWRGVRPYVPFTEPHAEQLRERFRDVTISTVIGTGLTALAQGVAVALSFAFVGLSDPIFWGVVTLVFAILPVLGSGMIWIPAVAVLAIDGSLGGAVFVAAWNIAATGLIDYGIRPYVFNRFARIHPLITLIGAIAGVSYFGLLGLLIGPLALSYFFEIVRMYREEYVPAGSDSGFTDEYASLPLPRVSGPVPVPPPPAAPETTDG